SSDVCSSDLLEQMAQQQQLGLAAESPAPVPSGNHRAQPGEGPAWTDRPMVLNADAFAAVQPLNGKTGLGLVSHPAIGKEILTLLLLRPVERAPERAHAEIMFSLQRLPFLKIRQRPDPHQFSCID